MNAIDPRRDVTPTLSVRGLTVAFQTASGQVNAIEEVDFDVRANEVLGVVGESGSGKSVTMLAVMGLLPPQARVLAGEVWFEGADLLKASTSDLRHIRGNHLAYIFQDPMTSFNPVRRIGWQIGETIRLHHPKLSRRAVNERVIELLASVGVPNPERRATQFPHEFSGGMRQRAMIAMSIANDPAMLIADEPTTALDVTIQAQVMEVLARARTRTGAGMVLITHDLGLVAESADRVAVMYSGRIVETGTVAEVFSSPRHPYTTSLMSARPSLRASDQPLFSIPGQPPTISNRATGCAFHPRCVMRNGRSICAEERPALVGVSDRAGAAACHFSDEVPAWSRALVASLEAPRVPEVAR